MGFMDELKKLARPYAEDEDDFDEFEEDVAPAHSNTRAAPPRLLLNKRHSACDDVRDLSASLRY